MHWHNVYRCMHWGPGHSLRWNDEIAANAQIWANRKNGQMVHSSDDYRSNVGGFDHLGENLYKSSGTPAGKDVVTAWYDEIKLTNGGHVYSFRDGIGHYTQVIWKGTKAVGCGIRNNMVDCEYGPAGNMGGEFASNTDAPRYSQAYCESHVAAGLAASGEKSDGDVFRSPFPIVLTAAASGLGVASLAWLTTRRLGAAQVREPLISDDM